MVSALRKQFLKDFRQEDVLIRSHPVERLI